MGQWLEDDARGQQRADRIRKQRESKSLLHELKVAEHIVGARDGLHADTRLLVEGGDHIVQRGRKRPIHRDARQIVQQVHRDAFASGQCMVRREDDDDLLAHEIDDLEPLDVQRPAHERHVKRPRSQPRDRFDGVLAVQEEAKVREVRGDKRAQWRKDSDVGCRKGSYRQIAGAPSGGLLRESARMLDATKDVFRLTQEGAAGARQRDVMTTPIEQRDANRHLELANLLAERGLRGVQAAGGAREVQLLGHRHEVPQMPQLHPDRLDGAANNRNLETLAVSRGMSYDGGPRAGDPAEVEWYSCHPSQKGV